MRINCTGLCMSDVHLMANDWGFPPMATMGTKCPGHEGAGVVVATGENVNDWKVGDRAGIKAIWDTCGTCELCQNDLENYCSGCKMAGYFVDGPRIFFRTLSRRTWTNESRIGTCKQYIRSAAKYTTRIPEGVEDAVAAPILCSAMTSKPPSFSP